MKIALIKLAVRFGNIGFQKLVRPTIIHLKLPFLKEKWQQEYAFCFLCFNNWIDVHNSTIYRIKEKDSQMTQEESYK